MKSQLLFTTTLLIFRVAFCYNTINDRIMTCDDIYFMRKECLNDNSFFEAAVFFDEYLNVLFENYGRTQCFFLGRFIARPVSEQLLDMKVDLQDVLVLRKDSADPRTEFIAWVSSSGVKRKDECDGSLKEIILDKQLLSCDKRIILMGFNTQMFRLESLIEKWLTKRDPNPYFSIISYHIFTDEAIILQRGLKCQNRSVELMIPEKSQSFKMDKSSIREEKIMSN